MSEEDDPLGWLLEWQATRRQKSSASWRADLFPEQLAFLDDPARRKAAVCGRRAGKTWVAVTGLYAASLEHPNALAPYIGLTAKSARRYFWPTVVELNARYKLGLELKEHELEAKLPNGAVMFAVGGDDRKKVEALRGGKYPRAVIDESGSFPRDLLKYLCDDVMRPALMDYRGDLWLIGSPNAACVGHFYDLTTGTNPEVARISTHHWNSLQNKHLPHARDELDDVLRESHWTEDHPTYQREWLGNWVRDTNSLVFRFDRGRHVIAEAPECSHFVIGVDLGSSQKVESFATVVAGWQRWSRKAFVLRARKHANMDPYSGAEELRKLLREYPNATIMVDEGGLGKGWADEWRKREGLPCKAAEKRDKAGAIRLVNGELDRTGLQFVAGKTEPLLQELDLLQWDEDHDEFDDRFADHACFPAGTPIETEAGSKPIEAIKTGDRVWTRRGVRNILASGQTGVEQLWRVDTSTGETLFVTGNHPVWADDHWTSVDALVYGSRLFTWVEFNQKPSSLTVERTEDIRDHLGESCASTFGARVGSGYTSPCGRKQTDRCPKDTMCIMSTGIRSTTNCTTCDACRPRITYPNMAANQAGERHPDETSSAQETVPQSGTDQNKGESGTQGLPSSHGSEPYRTSMSASFAAGCLKPEPSGPKCARPDASPKPAGTAASTTRLDSVPNAGTRSLATDTRSKPVVPCRVLRASKTGIVAPVYNLTVDGEHEYFANGILVSNCDAMLYAWRECFAWSEATKPKDDPRPGSPEAIAEQARKAKEKAIKDSLRRERKAFEQMARQLRR